MCVKSKLEDQNRTSMLLSNFLENNFQTPPPRPLLSILFIDLISCPMDIIGHGAKAPGPLACSSHGARPNGIERPQIMILCSSINMKLSDCAVSADPFHFKVYFQIN